MGTLEDALLGDVSVVELATRLQKDLPEPLARKLHSRTGYFRDDAEHGRLYARPSRESGELELATTDAKTRRDADVRQEIRRKLRAAGAAEDEVAAALTRYEALAAGETFEIAPGQQVLKPVDVAGREFHRTYDEPIVPAVVPLGIAYLFLACALGDRVYDASLDPLRSALAEALDGDDSAANAWPIDFLRPQGDEAAPLLGLVLEDVAGEAVIRVVVFRWYVWRVRVPQLAPSARRLHYARYLDSGEEETNLPAASH